jgi:hypothetical protein
MQVPDLWLTDLPMLQIVVKLQVSSHGTFSLDQLMDRVGLLDHGDSYTGLTPWGVTESLPRLAEGNLVEFGPGFEPDEDDGEDDDYFSGLERRFFSHQGRGQGLRIEEAFFKGRTFEDAYWRGGRFFVDGKVMTWRLRSTPDGLRRVGAWPNPEKLSEDLIVILGNLAESIEKQNPGDARKLREIGKVLKSNAIELSAALLAKLLEHAAGL